jgi:hypothetical protein
VNGSQDVTYSADFRTGRSGRRKKEIAFPDPGSSDDERCSRLIPRVARLMALAIRFDRLFREETVRDYAELARLGHVTRARMTQIMKLLDLAPDLQEEILFLPPVKGLTERCLRPLVSQLDWREQRRLFQQMVAE